MLEKEKRIIKSVAGSIPKMTEFEKGYLLGMAESKVEGNKTTKYKRDKKQ